MRTISQLRYDALAGYTRTPFTLIFGIEHEWWSEANDKVLGVIVEDTTDRDFISIVSGRDAAEQIGQFPHQVTRGGVRL
jgi:hypothetical protein